MSEKYISRDYLHDKLVACKLEFLDARKYARAEGVGACMAIVFDAPTIEAEPIKHGKWEKKGISIKGIEKEFCSECKTWSYGRNKAYCPNCGARCDL